MEKHGAKAFVEGNHYSHVKKKTLWRRHPSTKDCSLCGGAGNAAPPAATLWVWTIVRHGQLTDTSCPMHRQLTESWGERQTTSGKSWESLCVQQRGKTSRKWRELVGAACSQSTGQRVPSLSTGESKSLLQLPYSLTLTSFPVTFQQTAVYCRSLIVYVSNDLSVRHFLRINGQLEWNWWPEVKPEAVKNTWSFNHLNAA